MPRFFKKKNPKKKGMRTGRFRKRNTYTKRSQQIVNYKPKDQVNVGLGLPKKIKFVHKYRQAFGHTSTAVSGAMTSAIFGCNTMFDVDITGVGHQPMYFDQISPLYDHYTVIGSRIKVTIVNASTTVPFRYGLFVNDDATVVPTTLDGVAEQGTGKEIMVPVGGGFKHVLTSSWSAKKFFGGSILGNPNMQGTATANPTETSTWALCIESTLAGAQATAHVQVEIEYIAIWTELHDIVSS